MNLFWIKNEFIPANDFDDKSIIEKNNKAYPKNQNPI
jgi:hypothetical protein